MDRYPERWLPASVTLGAWAGFCWFHSPYGPLDGFLIGTAVIVCVRAVIALL
jgi:hypothetical protein